MENLEILNTSEQIKSKIKEAKKRVAVYQLDTLHNYNSFISDEEWLVSPFSSNLYLKEMTSSKKDSEASHLQIFIYPSVIQSVSYSYQQELVLQKGQCSVVINNYIYELPKGKNFFIEPDQEHDIVCKEETLISSIFRPKLKKIK